MVNWLHPYTGGGDKPDPLKGALAGAAGGFVGSLRMGRLTAVWNKLNGKLDQSDNPHLKPAVAARGQPDDPRSDPLPSYGDRVQAEAERDTAAAVIEKVTGREPDAEETAIGGQVVHHATGILAGAIYGVACEYAPGLAKTKGLPLGVGTFLLGREGGQWLTGLSKAPTEQPAADHLVGLGSHLAYGVFCELTRSSLRRALAED